MTIEAPVQVDLSQDLAEQGLKLSPDQQASLQNYLNTLKQEEREGIIYLTQQELSKLKGILGETGVDENDMINASYIDPSSLQEFIEEQKEEGLSSSDIIGSIEGIPEGMLDQVDILSYKKLFGNEGIMKDIELSDTARDNIAVSLSLSAMKQLQSVSLENYEEKFEELLPKLDIIQNVFGNIEGTGIGDLEHSLFIAGAGEQNYVFMDAMEGVKFFNALFTGDLEGNAIESYIEERNLPAGSTTEISHQMLALQEFARKNAKAPAEGLVPTITPEDSEVIVNDIPENPEEQQELIDRLKEGNFFEKILAAFLEAMKGFGLYNEDTENTEENKENLVDPEAEEVAPKVTEIARNLFRTKISEGSISPFTLTQIQELFPEEGDLSEIAQEIVDIIQGIGENTPEGFQEEFDNLFGLIEGENTSKFMAFLKASGDTLTQDSRIPGENFLAILQEYKRYRSDGTGEDYILYFDSPYPEREAIN